MTCEMPSGEESNNDNRVDPDQSALLEQSDNGLHCFL